MFIGKAKRLPPVLKALIALLVLGVLSVFILITAKVAEGPNKSSLETTAKEISRLADEGNFETIYDNYLDDTYRTKYSRETYVTKSKDFSTKYPVIRSTRHEVIVIGSKGFINRTISLCKDTACSDANTRRKYVTYVYENGWKITTEEKLCIRDSRYTIPPEFDRALSLIMQRYREQGGEDSVSGIKAVINCLDIQYSTNDQEINNAEGIFTFDSNSSPERLQIFVSPRYQAKDDLLTAILLVHEMTHALIYSEGREISCFENEAYAFGNEFSFIYTINQEERNSLQARLLNYPSEEIRGLNNTMLAIYNSPGSDIYERASNYVQRDPFYIQQCNS